MADLAATADAPLTRLHRGYFAAVGLFAIWVGLWGYFVPTKVDRAIPWLVPPLHARFLGSMYLSGTILLFGSLFARQRSQVSIALVMAYVWTGMLGIVSFIHFDEFDFSFGRVWFWFFAYVVYPIVGLGLSIPHRAELASVRRGHQIPATLRRWMAVQAALCMTLAGLLFVAPTAMSERWPWAITTLLAQIYSGPFLAYGIGSLLVSRHPAWEEARIPMLSIAVFAALVLTASFIHRDLFEARSFSAILWFGGFSMAVVFMVYALAGSVERRGTRL